MKFPWKSWLAPLVPVPGRGPVRLLRHDRGDPRRHRRRTRDPAALDHGHDAAAGPTCHPAAQHPRAGGPTETAPPLAPRPSAEPGRPEPKVEAPKAEDERRTSPRRKSKKEEDKKDEPKN